MSTTAENPSTRLIFFKTTYAILPEYRLEFGAVSLSHDTPRLGDEVMINGTQYLIVNVNGPMNTALSDRAIDNDEQTGEMEAIGERGTLYYHCFVKRPDAIYQT